jgi:hypothetical protein
LLIRLYKRIDISSYLEPNHVLRNRDECKSGKYYSKKRSFDKSVGLLSDEGVAIANINIIPY